MRVLDTESGGRASVPLLVLERGPAWAAVLEMSPSCLDAELLRLRDGPVAPGQPHAPEGGDRG